MLTAGVLEGWYLRAMDMLAMERGVGTVSIEGLEWAEVDFPQDVEIARKLTAKWVADGRSEEHTSELQSLMRISYAVFCLKKKNKKLLNKRGTHNNTILYNYNMRY